MKRRIYDNEFKLMAVDLVESGKTTVEVAESLGLRRDIVTRWRREFKTHGRDYFLTGEKKEISSHEKELLLLRKQLQTAKLENEILKKAVGIFSSSDGKSINL